MTSETTNYVEKKRYGILQQIPAVTIVLAFYLSQYKSFIPGITLGELALIFGCSVQLLISNLRISPQKSRLVLYYYLIAFVCSMIAIMITPISYSMVSKLDVLTRWIRSFAYVFFILTLSETKNVKSNILNLYRVVCYAVAIYGILQFIIYILFHYYLPVNILPFKMSRIADADTDYLLERASKYYMRARSVFVEPGYFAKFLLPAVVFSLYGWKEKKVFRKSLLLFLIAILLSGSVQGIILSAVILIVYLFGNKKLSAKVIKRILISAMSLVLIVVVSSNLGLLDKPIQRITNIVYGENIDRSTQLRVFRGFSYWGQLPLENKFFGVGMGNAANYANSYNITTEYDYYTSSEATLDYMSGISSIMVTHGFPCILMLVYMLWHYKKNMCKRSYIIILTFVISLFGGGSFLSIIGVLYFCLAFSSNDETEKLHSQGNATNYNCIGLTIKEN